ncbi:predicted protein [Streptomyces iranensis]|uniref:3-octaprenyl-4-hydroxybenzoate carboxy-lyase-like N-terminal domain-containing protein n=1 Tax=Streptomyces iranensis TaxID=576784 RepID=A0A060ZJ14_9ACTN|nr:UbiD family decarboxylase domain-containing protein [Streptomyces iranensis]MBP2068605.1 hypothetical protein [Streptomyces iranensis]CDR01140.1 predicted protein [Streptomyces iranensis]
MRHTDLRGFIAALEKMGGLTVVDREIDGDMEAAAVTPRSYELRSRAPLFTTITSAPGFRILGAPAGVSTVEGAPYARLALSPGLPPECTAQHILAPGQHIGHVRKLWSELGQPMPYALAQGPEPAVSVVSGAAADRRRRGIRWLMVTVPADWRTGRPGVTPEELARLTGEKAFLSKPGFIYPTIFVFDDDTDPSDPAEAHLGDRHPGPPHRAPRRLREVPDHVDGDVLFAGRAALDDRPASPSTTACGPRPARAVSRELLLPKLEGKPLGAMRAYLDAMDAAPIHVTRPGRAAATGTRRPPGRRVRPGPIGRPAARTPSSSGYATSLRRAPTTSASTC